MASVDPVEMIADLRHKARKLLEAAQVIEDAYGLKPTAKQLENGSPAKTDRRAQLTEFLRKHGPTKRRIIAERSGIPLGTIAVLLGSDDFVQLKHGVWGLQDTE